MIPDSEFIEQLHTAKHNYIQKGHHFVKISSKDELQNNVKLSITDDEPPHENIDSVTKQISSELRNRSNSRETINFIFTGNIRHASEIECKRWFIRFLSGHCNKITKYFFNKKLEILTNLIDWFLTVYSSNESDHVKYNFQHCLLACSEPSKSNIHSNLIWFDHTFVPRGCADCSAYKIFYIVAIGSENRVIHSSTSSIIENRFITQDLLHRAKSEMNNLMKILKQINFSDHEIKSIFEIIIALIELSQYRAQGDDKKLEFIGMGHLNKAAENLLVKEKQLKDFLINEYLWIDNKRKLKSADIVNYEIDSFITAIYDVLITRIFDKYNKYVEMESGSEEMSVIKFLSGPAIPDFKKDKTFSYGHFYQYYLSTVFESASADIISTEVTTCVSFDPARSWSGKIGDSKKLPANEKHFLKIFELISQYKNSKNRSEFLHKLEKKDMKTIKILKIDQRFYIDIFIPQVFSFIRFDWQSFVYGSEIQSCKHIMNFLKLSSLPLIQNCKVKKFSGRIWNADDISWIFPEKFAFNMDVFLIHLLVKEDCQGVDKISLKSQINNRNLQLLQIDEITFESILLDGFIEKFQVLFLNFGDNSRTGREAGLHAIYRLKLSEAWCCTDYIHLKSSQIREIESQVDNYHRYVIKLQGYARIIAAKMKLNSLKSKALLYKAEYLEAVSKSLNFCKLFLSEYIPVVNVDRENFDLKMITSISPDQIVIEKMKSIENNNVPWLRLSVISKMSILHEETFSGSKVCLFYSDQELPIIENCFNIYNCLNDEVRSQLNNVFALRITNESKSGDVKLDVKTLEPLFVWNVDTEVNKTKRYHLPLSQGYLYSMKQYRIFSGDYFIEKMAYNTITGISYDSFQDLVQECSIAIILQPDLVNDKSLTRSPLWISITNCLPLINLQSTQTFNLVEKHRRNMDKRDCSPYVNGMYTRPRNDWLIPNVSTQLLVMSLENIPVGRDSTDSARPERLSTSLTCVSKGNYKTKKYMNRK